MNKINVLHVIHSLDLGGAEKLVVEFVEGTNRKLFHTTVCCLDRVGKLGEILISKGFSVLTLKRKPGVDYKLICRLNKLFREKRIDIVHAHQYTPFFYTSLAKNYLKKPRIIFTEHGRFYPEKRKLKRFIIDPFLSLLASEIIAVSEFTKNSMVCYDNFPRKKIKVIFNGVNLKRSNINQVGKLKELNINSEDFVLATAARLDLAKNHIMLINVMKIITKVVPNCKLLIIGEGSEYEKLNAAINEYGLSEYVFLLGYRNDVLEMFFASDVFLLSSLTEGTSVTLLEAMYTGLPAIVTNVGGNPEILKDKVTGYLVNSNDAPAMAEKILLLFQNRDLAKKLGMEGRKRVVTQFSFETMLKKYEELYIKYAE